MITQMIAVVTIFCIAMFVIYCRRHDPLGQSELFWAVFGLLVVLVLAAIVAQVTREVRWISTKL